MNVSAGARLDVEDTVAWSEDDQAPWWQGLWFEGPFDPRGTGFAVVLALGATVAMVVVATALVRIVAGV